LRLPGTVASIALAAAACAFLGFELGREWYSGDEGEWMTEGVEAWRLTRAGRFDDPFWSQYHRLWGYASPPVSKLLVGMGMAAAGYDSLADLRRPPHLERAGPWQPPPPVVVAGRLSSVAVGGAAAGFLFALLARRGSRRTAAWAAILLASSPLWLSAARHAMTDVHGVAAVLALLPLFVAARDAAGGVLRAAPRWILAGAVAGLALGCKFSAAGAVLGLGVLALAGTPEKEGARGAGRRRVLGGIAAAALFGGAALLTFVATYPYLWTDPVDRFRGILEAWHRVREAHAERGVGPFEESFRPGVDSIRVLSRQILLPGGLATWGLLLPAVAAVVARGKGVAPARATLLVWTAALPAFALGALTSGTVRHAWIVWVGSVGAIGTAVVTPGVGRALASSPSASALAAATAGALAFILPTTYVGWARYYLPLFPGLAAAAAWSLVRLRDIVARSGGSLAAAALDASLAAGVLATALSFPESSGARMGRVAVDGGPATWAQRAALVLLVLSLATAVARSRRSAAAA
jgi:hypothetical protein